MQNGAVYSVRSPPPCGRAIACGQFSANGRNIGIEIGSCAQLWNPAALSRARFESKISTCDCPALVGEGWGGGSGCGAAQARQTTTPTPSPSPQGGGERTECRHCFASSTHKHALARWYADATHRSPPARGTKNI